MSETRTRIRSEQARPESAARGPAATGRALILGALLIPFNVYWVMMVEGIWHTGHPSVMALPWGVVFNIIVLLMANAVIRPIRPRWAFTQAELVTVYVMVGIAVMLAGHDTLQLGVPNLSQPYWYATEANNWEKLILPHLPEFATVGDMQVLRPYYEGHETLYRPERIMAWLWPTLWWCAVIVAVGLVMIGINVLLRRQWTESEKLGYPVVQLPLAMTEGGGSRRFFGDRVLWLGIALAAGLDIYNGLHSFWPALPLIDVRHNGTHYIDTRPWGLPWSAAGRIGVPLYPFLTALGFLIPLDLCFSMWFFFILRKLQEIVARAIAIPLMPGMPYATAQSFGAWFMLFGFAMWMGRRHFAELGRSIWTGAISGHVEAGDPMSYRGAVLAIAAGLGFLIFFCLRAGMSLAAVLPFLGFVIVIHTALTRVRAELGPPAHEMAGNMNAPQLEIIFAGTRGLGPGNLTMFPMFWWLSGRGYRTTPMPIQLEGFKMAQVSGAEPRRLALGMALAFLLGGFFSYWAAIHLTYQHGTTPLIGHNTGQWNLLGSWLSYPREPDWQQMIMIGAGALATWGMMWMRLQFLWWPLHPAGYALGMVFGVEYFWSCLLIAWVIKWAILHWAGQRAYQRFMPFVYGVIIGEYAVGAFWSALSVVLQRPLYDFSPTEGRASQRALPFPCRTTTAQAGAGAASPTAAAGGDDRAHSEHAPLPPPESRLLRAADTPVGGCRRTWAGLSNGNSRAAW